MSKSEHLDIRVSVIDGSEGPMQSVQLRFDKEALRLAKVPVERFVWSELEGYVFMMIEKALGK